MLMQSTPAIEMLVRADLIAQLALGIDLAALSGPGLGGAPLGIIGTSGVGHVIGGTDGATVTLDHLLALEASLNSNNAPVASRSFIMNGLTIAALKKLKSTTGQYLWTTDAPGQRSGTPGSINIALPELKDIPACRAAQGAIVAAVACGNLLADDGEALAALVEGQRRAMETETLEARLLAIEERLGKLR